MTPRHSPPRLSRWLLHRALPKDVRHDVAGDLTEVLQRDANSRGVSAARWAYRRKVWSFARHFLWERVRESVGGLLGARVSVLDFRLGARMLARYPGLTIVGGLALAFAIAVGVSTFTFINTYLSSTLPLDEGDRIIAVRQMDAAAGAPEHRVAFDFSRWRRQFSSIVDLGAIRDRQSNLVTPDGVGAPVTLAELTAAAFRVARVAPSLGRGLQEEDERVGAPPIVILGHELWQQRFAADPGVVGRVVALDGVPSTVIGVMPETFLYPVAHEAWTAMQLNAATVAPRAGPSTRVVGRLAPGVSLTQAQAEVAAIGAQMARDLPDSHRLLRPEVLPYAASIVQMGPIERIILFSVNGFIIMLLVLVSGNVALLMFARTASREREIVVRSALGATRARMVAQFFVEALVLGSIAAVAGLVVARFGLAWGFESFSIAASDGERLPFWFTPTLSPTAIAYTAGLTVLAAVISGVMPAVKVTQGLQSRLKAVTAGGGGLAFGGIWTFIIVVQVGVTVAFPVTAFFIKRDGMQIESVEIGVPVERFLTARLETSVSTAERLVQRLEGEPGVVAATLGHRLPLMYHPLRVIEVEGIVSGPVSITDDPRVTHAGVVPRFFAAFNAPILVGRGFTESDRDSDHRVVIVNESLVASQFGGMNPVGRRLRFAADGDHAEPAPWAEVIGVVRDLGMGVPPSPAVSGLYSPLSTEDTGTLHIAVRVAGDAAEMAPTLRAAATATDAHLRMYDVRPLRDVTIAELRSVDFFFRMTLGVSAVALGLSLASIYAVMAFTVSRRTREIGIRIALGSDRMRVVLAILRRPLAQVAGGLGGGLIFTTWMVHSIYSRSLTSSQWLMILAYGGLMLLVCLLACIVPTRRALSVQPTEALRTE